MPREDLDVVVAGFGLAGAVFHAPLIAATPGLRVSAIVTRSPERRAQATASYPQARVVDRLEDVLAAGHRPNLVVVATPNRLHVPMAQAALEAGVPVVVDKPLAAGAVEGRRLVDEAARRGLLLTVFHNRRWDGDFLTVRRLADGGELGQVTRFESRYERWRPVVAQRWRELADPQDAGGLLFDLGTHLVDQAVLLFGRPLRVYAEVDRRRPGAQVDDDAFVALEHHGGVRSHLWVSMVAALDGPRFRVLGSAGSFEKHGLDPQEAALREGLRPGDRGWGHEPAENRGRLAAGGEVRTVETLPGAYERFYADLEHALRTGGPPPVDPQDAVLGLEILEAARESARTGTVAELSDRPGR